MLEGSLREVRFAWPEERNDDSVEAGDIQEMHQTGSTLLEMNGVCYINGTVFPSFSMIRICKAVWLLLKCK